MLKRQNAFTLPRMSSWPTFVTVIRYLAQVNKMSSYGNVVDLIRVSYLDLKAFAEWREELGEDDLLVPDRLITALLDRWLPLETHEGGTVISESWGINKITTSVVVRLCVSILSSVIVRCNCFLYSKQPQRNPFSQPRDGTKPQCLFCEVIHFDFKKKKISRTCLFFLQSFISSWLRWRKKMDFDTKGHWYWFDLFNRQQRKLRLASVRLWSLSPHYLRWDCGRQLFVADMDRENDYSN